MLKWLAILAVGILGATLYVAIQNQHAASQATQQTYPEAKAPAAQGPGNIQPQEDKQNPHRDSPSWYAFFTWPDSMTAWAILLTLWAIAWQANETKKAAEATQESAKAMRGSIVLQEATLRQWVSVEFLRSKFDGALFDSSGQLSQQLTVEVRFQVINPTPLPLTIKRIVTEVSGAFEKSGPDYERFTIEDNETLKPRGKEGEVGYRFYVTLNLVGERVKLYQVGNLIVAFSSTIFYESAARKMEEQSFESVLQLGPSFSDKIVEYKGKPPHKAKSDKDPN